MSKHTIPSNIDITTLKAQVTRLIREPVVMYENAPEHPATALVFTPNLTAGETTILTSIFDQLDPTQDSALRTLIINLAQSAVGLQVDALTAAQTRALVAILLYKQGALTPTGAVKPLNQWAQ